MWEQVISLCVVLAGLIVGLGAVTVIDTLGFLGRRSGYWTETTIRTHKVTKPLIWFGSVLFAIGLLLWREDSASQTVWLWQMLIVGILILNGCFLSFWVSPRLLRREQEDRAQELLPSAWQRAITVSFLISFFGWWGSVVLLVWQLVSRI